MKRDWLFSIPSCSCMTLTSRQKKPYWFRTCDIDADLKQGGAHIVEKKKGEYLLFSGGGKQCVRYDLMGISYDQSDSWLLDGINEAGLVGGLLMLLEGTSVKEAEEGYFGCMGMELVAGLLSVCRDVEEVKQAAKKIQILDVPYKGGSVAASMHYFFADIKGNETVLEASDPDSLGRLKIYGWEETIGVMTNSPVYPDQLKNLSWFMSESAELCQGREGKPISQLSFDQRVISSDPGAWHISREGSFPGGYSSYDRFIRLAVIKALNDCGNRIEDEKMMAFGSHLMSTVIEPPTQGLFHYHHRDEEGRIIGQQEGCTRYLVAYDLKQRRMRVQFTDETGARELSLQQTLTRTPGIDRIAEK